MLDFPGLHQRRERHYLEQGVIRSYRSNGIQNWHPELETILWLGFETEAGRIGNQGGCGLKLAIEQGGVRNSSPGGIHNFYAGIQNWPPGGILISTLGLETGLWSVLRLLIL